MDAGIVRKCEAYNCDWEEVRAWNSDANVAVEIQSEEVSEETDVEVHVCIACTSFILARARKSSPDPEPSFDEENDLKSFVEVFFTSALKEQVKKEAWSLPEVSLR